MCWGGVRQFFSMFLGGLLGTRGVAVGEEVWVPVRNMVLVLGLLSTISVAVQLHGSPTVPGVCPQDGLADLTASAVDGASPSEDRPSAGETTIAVHRQTSKRLDVAPVAWEYIPVHHNTLPEEILSDMAHWYTDIHDDWERVSWWLCRIHSSSRFSSQPVLAVTNYVLVQEEDFLAADMRPHGLFEFVLGEDRVVFPTPFPRWINLSVLRTFLEPMTSHMHFGVAVQGSYNGGMIGHRLIRCESGFFIQVQFLSTPFILSELYRSAPLHVATLHTVTEYPSANDVRWSVVYIAGGNTLISSRVFVRVDVHAKVALTRGLLQRFPDLGDVNFDFVKVHWSISSLEPVVNHVKVYYVLSVIDEELSESLVVLKLDLPPYRDIGAVLVPQILTKSRLVTQTHIDMVCGPEGEVCACYHNGHELLSGEETNAYDGDFFACWLEAEPGNTFSATLGRVLSIEYNCSAPPASGVDHVQ